MKTNEIEKTLKALQEYTHTHTHTHSFKRLMYKKEERQFMSTTHELSF